MSNGPCWTPLRFCVTCILCAHRSLRTTLHQPLSQPLWWDSQWRPLSPTTMPKSPLEPPRSLVCRLLSDRGLLFQFSKARQMKSASMTSCVSSAPPAAAHRTGGAERNPSWTRGPQIHLWQSGSALPAGCKRPSKSPRVSVASAKKNICIDCTKKRNNLGVFYDMNHHKCFLFSKQKENLMMLPNAWDTCMTSSESSR